MNTSLPKSMVTTEVYKKRFAFILVISLALLGPFPSNLDPILIPHLEKTLTPTTTQSTLVDSAMYITYFLIAPRAGYVIRRFSYKVGIVTGLILFSKSAFLSIPAKLTDINFSTLIDWYEQQ